MIRVTIEMFPGGKEANKRILGTAIITNDGTGTNKIGNYKYTLFNKARNKYKQGKIKKFDRQNKIAWRLLNLILNDAFEKK